MKEGDASSSTAPHPHPRKSEILHSYPGCSGNPARAEEESGSVLASESRKFQVTPAGEGRGGEGGGGTAASTMQRADVTEPGTRGWLQRPEGGREEEGDGMGDSHPESQNCVVE